MKFTYSFALAAALVGFVGCSETAKTEIKEAAEQSKEAAAAVGADTKAAAEEGVEKTKEVVSDAADAVGEAADKTADAVKGE